MGGGGEESLELILYLRQAQFMFTTRFACVAENERLYFLVLPVQHVCGSLVVCRLRNDHLQRAILTQALSPSQRSIILAKEVRFCSSTGVSVGTHPNTLHKHVGCLTVSLKSKLQLF